MPIRAEKLRDENPGRTPKGRYTTELYEVMFIDDGTGSHNENGICDPTMFETVSGLPKYGDKHPVLDGAQVADVRVVQVVANWSYIVSVTYRGWGLYTGGPRAIVRAYNGTRFIEIPIWNRFTDGIVVGWAKPDKRPMYPRMVAMRSETRFLGGNQVSAVQTAIAANAGTLWQIDGLWYRLSSQCQAFYDGLAYTRAEYVFERECEIQAIPADPSGAAWGNDNSIPYLPPLYVWSERPDTMSSANPPIVRAVPPPALTGGAPAYPNLPGFP